MDENGFNWFYCTPQCFIPNVTSYSWAYSSGCVVESCDPGLKPDSNKTACEACGVANVTSYSSGCVVDSCDTGLKPDSNKTACEDCGVDKATSLKPDSNKTACEDCGV